MDDQAFRPLSVGKVSRFQALGLVYIEREGGDPLQDEKLFWKLQKEKFFFFILALENHARKWKMFQIESTKSGSWPESRALNSNFRLYYGKNNPKLRSVC